MWERINTGRWEFILGGVVRAYLRRGGSGRYYVEIPRDGGMTYPQDEFETLRGAKAYAEAQVL